MCLAIPANVIKQNGSRAEVDIMGIRTTINVLLVEDLQVGDKVMVHAGFAISKIDDAYYDFLKDTLQKVLDGAP